MFYTNICVYFLILFNSFFNTLGNLPCPTPIIINGNYFLSQNRLGYEAKFQCRGNYTIQGAPFNRCKNGKWKHPIPICQRNEMECVAPTVNKGYVVCLTVRCNRFYVGTEAAVRCEQGYRLVGSSRMHCRYKSKWKPSWSSPVPKCVLIETDQESDQDHQPFNLFYTENSSIMIIIIILSVLAGGLMLLMSIMLMNRLFQRRRMMRIQRSENSFNQPAVIEVPNTDIDRNVSNFPSTRETCTEPTARWNCFRTLTSRNSRYQHMDTQTTEPTQTFEPENNPPDNFEFYNNTIYSDDQTSLIQPPCYEEAVKCSQYSIVASKNSMDHHKLRGSQVKGKSNTSKSSVDKESQQSSNRQVDASSLTNDATGIINQSVTSIANTSMQSNFSVFQNSNDNKSYSQSSVVNRSNDLDNVSRRSTRVHCPRVTNNITSESNGSFRSGSIETMAISDGTSVTVHTLDSRGSNPSLGSMRPQTGSIGDPTNYVNNCPAQYRHPLTQERSSTPFTESDFAVSDSRYSPPPSYECSINHPMVLKGSRSSHSNTASPSTNSNVVLFVDNMACIEDPIEIPS